MAGVEVAEVLVLSAAALHAGFQLTVTIVVYPALLHAEPFGPAHARHTSSIVPVVALVYGALVASGVLRLLVGDVDAAAVVALGGAVVAAATTALVAAPTHGRLEEGRSEVLSRRLVRADLVRTAAAVVGLGGALAAPLG